MPSAQKRDPDEVKEMFGAVAKNYDKINRAMCFGLDILWRKNLAKTAIGDKLASAPKVVDIACGSGDVCVEILKLDNTANVVGADFCPEMLTIAEEKTNKLQLSNRVKFLQADCENLPFESNSFDAATISFGFRNFQNRLKCLSEIARILKPDGRLAILEVSRTNAFMEFAQKIFMGTFVPTIATLLGGRKKDYTYLANTTMQYPRSKEVEQMFVEAGFENVKTKKFGCGLVAITTGTKKDL